MNAPLPARRHHLITLESTAWDQSAWLIWNLPVMPISACADGMPKGGRW